MVLVKTPLSGTNGDINTDVSWSNFFPAASKESNHEYLPTYKVYARSVWCVRCKMYQQYTKMPNRSFGERERKKNDFWRNALLNCFSSQSNHTSDRLLWKMCLRLSAYLINLSPNTYVRLNKNGRWRTCVSRIKALDSSLCPKWSFWRYLISNEEICKQKCTYMYVCNQNSFSNGLQSPSTSL